MQTHLENCKGVKDLHEHSEVLTQALTTLWQSERAVLAELAVLA